MDQPLKKLVCVIPVFNDWENIDLLLPMIARAAGEKMNYDAHAVIIDDGSHARPQLTAPPGLPVSVLHLHYNAGHQRAIAVGLQYVAAEHPGAEYIIVLDSDGEDRPADICSLVQRCAEQKNGKIVFAKRKKRHASLFFKSGYFFYRMIFFLLTGHRISFGNFSCIPGTLLKKLVGLENIWVHYSGCVIQAKLPYSTLLLDRGKRFQGKSKMNSNSLVLHGLVAISVHFDSMSVRILKAAVAGFIVCVAAVLLVLYYKLFTSLAIPGWASNLILILLSIIVQLAAVTLIVLLMQLSSRKNVRVPDTTIYRQLIEKIVTARPVT